MRPARACTAVLGAALLAGLLSSCSTATPVLVRGAKLPDLLGRANVTAGYTGQITTENRVCRGSFSGVLGQSIVPFEMSCADGRSGVGTARIENGRFASGEVRLSDGTRLSVQASGPGYP